MTKIEALQALKDGHKISHEYYTDEEYLYMRNGIIFTEEGYNMGHDHSDFWAKIQKWEHGWFRLDEE